MPRPTESPGPGPAAPVTTSGGRQAAVGLVLGFAAQGLRDLPWRRTRDPWSVMVAETMLQQTQVARVVDPWSRFVGRFPTPAACASAGTAPVVAAWSGLGYNRRAVNLRRAAAVIVDAHAGAVPGTVGELVALPGVGPYTARAILAFAFECDVAVVDTNVRRVLRRAFAAAADPAALQALADDLVPRGRSWRWNQALIDLGATVCTARRPRCEACPLERVCAWRRTGGTTPDPAAAGRQSRFEGSNRQGRGRIVARLLEGPLTLAEAAAVTRWPAQPGRVRSVLDGLVADGLAVERADGTFACPD